MAESFPWDMIARIGVHSRNAGDQATAAQAVGQKPTVQIFPEWYY